jgi:hypothetical protein
MNNRFDDIAYKLAVVLGVATIILFIVVKILNILI